MGVQIANNAVSTLSGSIDAVVTTMSVQAGHGARFPSAAVVSGTWFYVTLIDAANNIEIVKVTDRTVDTFTITRARDGTTAQAFAADSRVELRPVAALFNELPNRLIVNADLTDNSIESVKLKTIAGLAPGTYGGATKHTVFTVNAKGQVTSVSEADAQITSYVEGTFTPELKFGGNSVGMTYGTQQGHYTKINRQVFVSIHVVLTAKGSSTGGVTIIGLPFAGSVNNVSTGSVFALVMTTTTDGVYFEFSGAVSALTLYSGGASGNAALSQGNINNTTTLKISFSYFV